MSQKSITRLTDLTRFLFICPSAKILAITIFLISALFSFAGLVIFSKPEYFFFLFVPTIALAGFARPIVLNLGEDLKNKHAFLISTFILICFATTLLFFNFLNSIFYISLVTIILISLPLIFLFNLFVFTFVSSLPMYKAVLPSLPYPLISALILGILKSTALAEWYNFLVLMLLSYILFSTFTCILNTYSKKSLGVKITDLVSLSLREYIGLKGIGNPFSKLGKLVEVPYQTVSFKNTLLTIPWLHPGPLGSVGGNLPSELRKALKSKSREAIFLHTYVDHSLDPIFLNKVVQDLKNIPLKGNIYKKATKVLKLQKRGITLIGQRFKDVYVFFSSFAPDVTEDIVPEIGLALLEKFNDKVILVDSHNSSGLHEEELMNIKAGSEKAKALLAGINELKRKLKNAKGHEFKTGASSLEGGFEDFGIKSISALCIEVNNQKAIYVVLDTNNLIHGFRKAILKKLSSKVQISEIMTTDTHLGDYAMKLHGKIGTLGREELESKILELADKALENLEKSRMKYSIKRTTAKVLGENVFNKLIELGNLTIPKAKLLILSCLVLYFLAAHYLFT